MMPRRLLAVFLLAAVTLTASARLLAQAIQKSLYVSVVDEAGAPVADIRSSDLIVREDNVAREILRITPADDPMQIAVLVDNSQASLDHIPDMRRAVGQFVDSVMAGGKNEVAVVALGGRPTILADYTRDRAQLQKGLDLVWAQTMTGNYLLDGIIEVTKGFKKREATRPIIVAVTTEGPELSSRYYDLVLTPLFDSGAAFYAFVLGPLMADTSTDTHNREMVLSEGTRLSGGQREIVLASSGLGVRMKQVADEITHEYRVTYARPQSLIPADRVTVTATRAGLTARGTLIKERQ